MLVELKRLLMMRIFQGHKLSVKVLAFVLLFFISCGGNGADNAVSQEPGVVSGSTEVSTDSVTLRELLKPKYRQVSEAVVSIDWKKDTLFPGNATCELYLDYPFIQGLDHFNDTINDLYQLKIQGFIETCEEEEEFIGGKFPGAFVGETGRLDSTVVSVLIEASTHYPGGARMLVNYQSFNYSLSEQKWLELSDLFDIPEDKLYSLLERIVVERTENSSLADDPEHFLYDDGNTLPKDVFSAFLISEESMVIFLGGGQSFRLVGLGQSIEIELDETIE